MNYPINFSRIESIKMDLGYSNDKKFAIDCGITYPTFMTIKKQETAWIKFINGLNALLVKNKMKPKKNTYFIKDTE